MKSMRGNVLEKAIAWALRAHAGQRDKAGAPYVLHPLRVMFAVEGVTARIAAVLHDVVEDTPTTLADLEAAGMPADAVRRVDLLTRRPGQGKTGYYRRLAADSVARSIKLADLEDNLDVRRLRRITARDARRLARYRAWRKRLLDAGWPAGRGGDARG